MYKILTNGDFAVKSRSSEGEWIVSSDLKKCSCPKFIYILHGNGVCHHIEEVINGEKLKPQLDNLNGFEKFNPDEYKIPLTLDNFATKYGDNQLNILIKLQVVINHRGIIRALK